MAEPARESTTAREPAGAADKHDPRARGWADVRLSLIADSHVIALAAAAVAGRPDDDGARLLLGYALEAFESTVAIARRWVVDEAVLAEERRRAYDEGAADCKAARCRLELLDGGA
ncbi:MAG TPA: hypothetical protein VFY14_08950 [Streptomyces sp.]|nr:hypothetical protein [Streptomyces sp.]